MPPAAGERDGSLEALLRKIIECQMALDDRAGSAMAAGLDRERERLEQSLCSYKAELQKIIVPWRHAKAANDGSGLNVRSAGPRSPVRNGERRARA